MRFTKMEGLGNDYVYIYGATAKIKDISEFARRVSDRHFGVGSDGLVLIEPSTKCDFSMRIFNADGSEAEMCGNASRCIGKFVYDKGYTEKRELTLETLAGVKRLTLFPENGVVKRVTVDMGAPILIPSEIPIKAQGERVVALPLSIMGREYRLTAVSMGNPHAVIFVDSVEEFDVEGVGRAIESHELFPERTNVEFIEVVDSSNLKMRVWERGSGETLACGTGASASLVASILNRRCGERATLHLRGGDLELEWRKADGHVYMTGEAGEVFEGEFKGERLTELLLP